MNQPSVILVGGPDVGKTNFLGKVWITLSSKKGVLAAEKLPEDMNYLIEVSNCLLKGEFADRTPVQQVGICHLPVTCTKGATPYTGTVVVPDRSGEQWVAVYEQRKWFGGMEASISNQSGCLVFLRPTSNRNKAAIDLVGYAEMFVVGHPNHEGADTQEHLVDQQEDGEGEPPTQVMIVDWIQCLKKVIGDKLGHQFRPRIGIVISAWDLVQMEYRDKSPKAFLEHNYPMLAQFILANTSSYDFQVFGVSVAGGDLKNDNEFCEQYCNANPTEAGYIVHELNGTLVKCNDFTLPLAWAMGVDQGI